jgi:hypothetical protein
MPTRSVDHPHDSTTATPKENEMMVRRQFEGHVIHNDGELAEIELIETELAPETGYGILMDIIQVDRYDFGESQEEFQQRFHVGERLNILITTEFKRMVTHLSKSHGARKRSTHRRDKATGG